MIKIILSILILIAYLPLNMLTHSYCTDKGQESSEDSSSLVNIGVSDSVSVQVTRPRWYGTIYISDSQNCHNEKLILFNILPIGIITHAIIITIIIFLTIPKKKEGKKCDISYI